MSNKTANLISAVFHPLLLPVFAAFIFLFSPDFYYSYLLNTQQKWVLILLVFLLTFLLPSAFLFFLVRVRFVSSLYLDKKEERPVPLLASVVFFYATYHLLKSIQQIPVFNYFMLGATLVLVVSLLISFWWKISLHMIAWGALTGTFTAMAYNQHSGQLHYIIPMLLISGWVGSSRLRLQAHQAPQLYAGFAVGFACMFLLFKLISL